MTSQKVILAPMDGLFAKTSNCIACCLLWRHIHPDQSGLEPRREVRLSLHHTIRHYSRDILIRMAVVFLFALGLIYWQLGFLTSIYLHHQLTHAGLLINGAIILLFLAGMVRLIMAFSFYAGEEESLRRFVDHMDQDFSDPAEGVRPDSMIARRYAMMLHLHQHHTPINHSAMAASLLAAESTRTTMPKFVNNILILTGVFGTIVSLSIALAGASDMLKSAVSVSGMGLVIYGMSTALSTTITAISCYLVFSYFFSALGDVQTHLLGHIEGMTATRLMPLFQINAKDVDYRVADLLSTISRLIHRMDEGQSGVLAITQRLETLLGQDSAMQQSIISELAAIRETLREGFRLQGRSE